MIENENKFPLASDSFSEEEISAAVAVLKSGKYTMGEKVRLFEERIANWCGARHALMVNSGSSANLLVIESLLRRTNAEPLLQPGNEVLVPALAWPTTVWPLVQLGLKPVFVDIDLQTMAIDVDSARRSLSKKTKAMFIIHVLGLAADMTAVQAFCRENSIALLEDCCESFGAFYQKKHVGLFGVAGTFSHFFSHHLTTMEGGTILTDDTKLYEDLKSFRAHGWTRDRSDKKQWETENPHLDPRFLFITSGYNVRPMEIQAAIGVVQLQKMESFLQKRCEVVQRIRPLLEGAQNMRIIGQEFLGSEKQALQDRRHTWMNIPILASSPEMRSKIMQKFESFGVETRPIIAGNMLKHPAAKVMNAVVRDSLHQCDQVLDRGFMIGCHPTVTEKQMSCLEKAVQAAGALS